MSAGFKISAVELVVVVAQQLASMDLLICSEVLYKDHQEDDLGLGGLRSLPDPALITDQRVLDNVLNGHNGSPQFDYFKTVQSQLKPHMRKIVADWMLEVTEEAKCSPEVFSLAVNYMDRVLSKIPIEKSQFQLLASVCIFLASKFKESSPLCAEKLVICSDFSFTTQEMMVSEAARPLYTFLLIHFLPLQKWELLVLELLNWDLSAITPYCILDQLLRRLAKPLHDLQDFDLTEVRNYSEAILNLALTESAFLTTSPCLIAVSSLITAMSNLGRVTSSSRGQQNEALVANFLHQLFEITNIRVEEISEVISQLEHIVRLRFAYVPTSSVQQQNTNQQPNTYSNNNSPYCNSESVNMVKTTTLVC